MTECKNPSEPSEDINNIYGAWVKLPMVLFQVAKMLIRLLVIWSITKYYKYEGDDFFGLEKLKDQLKKRKLFYYKN